MRSGDKEPDSRETPNILNSRVMIILDSTGSCRVGTGEKGSTREGQSVRRPLSHGTRDKGGPGLRLVGVDGLWAIQAVVPQHSAGCGDETDDKTATLIHNETFTIKYIVNVPVHSPGHCTQTVCRLPYFIEQSGAEEGDATS